MQAHSDMTSADQKSRAEKYAKEGKKLKWKMWVALETYAGEKELLYIAPCRETISH